MVAELLVQSEIFILMVKLEIPLDGTGRSKRCELILKS